MNYDKKGNIKPIEEEDITYEFIKNQGTPMAYSATELDYEGLINIINDLINEINELKKI